MPTLKESKISCSSGYFAFIFCLVSTLNLAPARADDQTMRTKYPDSSTGNSGQSSYSPSSYSPPPHVPRSYSPSASSGSGDSNDAPQAAPNSPTYGGHKFGGSFNGFGSAVRGILGPGQHLPSAAPNPATMPFQGGQSAQESEHQRVVENMRRAGYSNARIGAMDPYMHQPDDPAGTTYRTIGGIRYRNDGVTPGQALNNIINNGTMNTPIHADYHQYQPGTYGYYRGTGGTKTYGQWLNGDR